MDSDAAIAAAPLCPWAHSGVFTELDTRFESTVLVQTLSGSKDIAVRRAASSGVRFASDRAAPFTLYPAGEYRSIVSGDSASKGLALPIPRHLVASVLDQEDTQPDLLLLRGGFADQRLERMVAGIWSAQRRPDQACLVDSLHLSVVHLLLEAEGRLPETRRSAKFPPAMRRLVEDVIREHLSVGIALEQMATLTATSRSRFASLFRATFDTTLHQYIMNLRIREAESRIRASDLNMTEIAMSLGFSGGSHFSSAFRQNLGMSPGEYRKQRRRGRIGAGGS